MSPLCHLLLNMSKLMEVMTAKHMLIFSFCLIIITCISSQGLHGCDVEVRVQRGTVYRASPHQLVEVKCPVQYCGMTVLVVWCKFLDTSERTCKNLSNSDHIQINENRLSDERLESVLTFKRISAEDSGLYSCKEVYHRSVGHLINVAVSETNQTDQNHEKNPEQPKNYTKHPNENKMKMISLAFFVSFVCVLLLIFTFTAIVILRKYGCKPLPRHQTKPQEEQPSRMIPGLPKRSPPVLRQTLSAVDDFSSSVFEPPSIYSNRAIGNKILTGTSAAQRSPVYSQINRTKSQKSFHCHASGEGTSQMSAISVVTSEL